MANYNILESLSGGAIAKHLILGELLSGLTDGTNKIFTTSKNIYSSSIDVYVGSQGGFSLMGQGSSLDYTITGSNQITLTTAPPPGSVVFGDYITP